MPPYTLKYLAEAGYVMGLPTIGEVASHMRSHYDAYFLIENMAVEMEEFDTMVDGHEEESIFKYLTEDDKRRMDEELEKAMAEGSPDGGPRSDEQREASNEKDEEEGEQENKHF